jgi:hypothetical protein
MAVDQMTTLASFSHCYVTVSVVVSKTSAIKITASLPLQTIVLQRWVYWSFGYYGKLKEYENINCQNTESGNNVFSKAFFPISHIQLA